MLYSKKIFIVSLLGLIFGLSACSEKVKKEEEEKEEITAPVGVDFNKESIVRLGKRGDNWCLTWAKDGSQVVSMDDGNWLNQDISESKFHTHLYRITGDADNFEREDIPNYPELMGKEGSWFGYGILSVGNDLYSAISKTPLGNWSGPFTGIKLLKSPDNGDSWYRVDRQGKERSLSVKDEMRNVVNDEEMFSLKEFGMPHKEQEAYPFSFLDFVQCGQNNTAAKDDYVYMYAPEGAKAHQLNLARVPNDKIGIRDQWEYFTAYGTDGKPAWSKNIADRGYVHSFPEKSADGNYFGWYSWLPSVVWNEGLGLYIMANGGSYAGYGLTDSDEDYYDGWMHTETGSLGFWYSENAYGPWTQFYYTDYWTVDDEKNRTYQPKLSPKWISEDGKKMTLIWSDAMKNEAGKSHSTNYLWNHMEIEIKLE